LIGLIKLLKIWQHRTGADNIPHLEADDHKLCIEGRIMPSSWYALESYLRMLDAVYYLVYGGTFKGMLKMGLDAGDVAAQGPQKGLLKAGDPRRTLESLPVYWELSYNFASVSVTREAQYWCVRIKDYPDITRVHALLHLGFTTKILTLVGAEDVKCEVVAAPWEGADHSGISVVWRGFE